MKKGFLLLLIFSNLCYAGDTLRIVTYNVLNYSGGDRNPYLETVLAGIDADIIVLQEIVSQSGANEFATSVLNNQYATIPFHDGPDTDNHIFYRSDVVEFVSDNYIATALRDIAEYNIRLRSNGESLAIYSAHLKASSGSTNEQLRLAEATILRNYLNNKTTGSNFILVGDMNFYSSSEPAYQKIIGSESDNDGRLFDPIDSPGEWHNNGGFAGIHTQSPRVEQFGGGASGGLDDRFDFILASDGVMDNVIPSTYTEFGNDGNHFNLSINNGSNSAVSSDISNALYFASDHLPVFCDFVFPTIAGVSISGNGVHENVLYPNYPNPFNPSTHIRFDLWKTSQVRLVVYDAMGREVQSIQYGELAAGAHEYIFDASGMAAGVYYCSLESDGMRQVQKLLFLK